MTVAGTVLSAIPLAPQPDEARERLHRELADPVYAAAEPTLFDRVARAVGDFFARLLSPELPDGWGPAAALVAAVVAAIVIVAAILIWGRPRRSARSWSARREPLLGDGARSAAQLRADADAAARRGEWDEAVAARFRAIARGLVERAVVDPAPGVTAQAFAREAGRVFPPSGARLAAAAGAFDDVRYLRRPGTEALYREVAGLDDDLARALPVFAPPALAERPA